MAWYRRVFGRHADVVVNDDEVMWNVCGTGWLYVVHDGERAGNALVTQSVGDLDALVAELADRGIYRDPIEFVGDAGRRAVLRDPDSTHIAFIQVMASSLPTT